MLSHSARLRNRGIIVAKHKQKHEARREQIKQAQANMDKLKERARSTGAPELLHQLQNMYADRFRHQIVNKEHHHRELLPAERRTRKAKQQRANASKGE